MKNNKVKEKIQRKEKKRIEYSEKKKKRMKYREKKEQINNDKQIRKKVLIKNSW